MPRFAGVPSLTWPESVDEALCVGWIDGVLHRIDERRYRIRFSPRKARARRLRRFIGMCAAKRRFTW